jgi:hypothetical protein
MQREDRFKYIPDPKNDSRKNRFHYSEEGSHFVFPEIVEQLYAIPSRL